MNISPTYRKALFCALGLHVFLVAMLLTDNTSKRPVLTAENKTTPGMDLPVVTTPQPEVVKAVSVDSKEIMETVNKLKQEREQQHKAEVNRQNELNRQAEVAKQQRIKEQKQIAKLKEEANRIAIERKKQAEEEKKHLKELALQKAQEAKRIKELQEKKKELVKQQEAEVKKLAELNKKKQLDLAKAEKAKAEKTKAENAKAEKAKAEQKKQAIAAAAQNAENQARIAGEVDKYKALIVNAIGRNWILPENADSNSSCQFRIRLAPNGVVLEVTLTRSSGDPVLDRSAQTAINKASPLPVPSDAATFNLFRDISLTVRPEQVRG
ncbi:MAG: cell envelope integrity protein TolA [Legionella sp.]|jgi:colicin import membrane protein